MASLLAEQHSDLPTRSREDFPQQHCVLGIFVDTFIASQHPLLNLIKHFTEAFRCRFHHAAYNTWILQLREERTRVFRGGRQESVEFARSSGESLDAIGAAGTEVVN